MGRISRYRVGHRSQGATLEGQRSQRPRRAKSTLAHVVPLSDQALAIVDRAAELRRTNEPEDLLFPNSNPTSTQVKLNELTNEVAKKIGYDSEVTAHGWRSTFTDWTGNETEVDRETRDFCLAHVSKESYEAYRRTTSVNKRGVLMQLWSNYVQGVAVDRHCDPQVNQAR